MNRTPTVIMSDGMACLIKTLGVIDAEKFICGVLSERNFDYSVWRERYFRDVDIPAFVREAADYCAEMTPKKRRSRCNVSA
ncbi:hypothetical protein AGMMS49959_14310 [Planctomycetales bacterium]|nr:hypothetical protein AGMMS49959_14310 [Planctomycetales bacterium]